MSIYIKRSDSSEVGIVSFNVPTILIPSLMSKVMLRICWLVLSCFALVQSNLRGNSNILNQGSAQNGARGTNLQNTQVLPGVSGKPSTTEEFPLSSVLESDIYYLYWKFNATHITFEVHVRTTGYVGFGISKNGKMYPADIVVGWIKDGVTYFKDRYTDVSQSSGRYPNIDTSQDWELLEAQENQAWTLLKFVRRLDTCDDQDFRIKEETVRVVYAYSPNDPDEPDSRLHYHSPTRRGTKSLTLLAHSRRQTSLPENVGTYDFFNQNYNVPMSITVYHCVGFHIQGIPGKRHIIKYEPVITPGNERIVHHILVYRCDNVNPRHHGISYDCYWPQIHLPSSLRQCRSVFIGWAIGGQVFYYPNNVGLSIGADDDSAFYVMETHYDNPERRSDIIDNSGLRISYTATLRQHEAGLLESGVRVSWRQMIPPRYNEFVSRGICTSECLQQGMGDESDGIKIFAVFQHSHLLGRKIRTRHIRNGVELTPIADDQNYDFDYQEARVLKEEITVNQTDQILVECTYDSSAKEDFTYGGLATSDEMCLSYIMYYPRMKVDKCQSMPSWTYEQLVNTSRISYNTEEGKQMFDVIHNSVPHKTLCYSRNFTIRFQERVVDNENPRIPYVELNQMCN